MTYELWDRDTGNLVEVADNAADIFAAVREYIEQEAIPIDELAYRVVDDAGKTVERLIGAALVQRVGEAVPA